jgi:hypothetical protein
MSALSSRSSVNENSNSGRFIDQGGGLLSSEVPPVEAKTGGTPRAPKCRWVLAPLRTLLLLKSAELVDRPLRGAAALNIALCGFRAPSARADIGGMILPPLRHDPEHDAPSSKTNSSRATSSPKRSRPKLRSRRRSCGVTALARAHTPVRAPTLSRMVVHRTQAHL